MKETSRIDRVDHEGKVVEITADTISVEIINKSACAACHAKGVCIASDAASKIIEIPYTLGTLSQHFEVGEKVNVSLRSSLGMRATIFAYGVPLALLLIILIVASKCGAGELWTGLWGIIGVAAYYVVLSFFKNKLSKVFTFSIDKLS